MSTKNCEIMRLPTDLTKVHFTALANIEKEISKMPDNQNSKSTEQLLEAIRKYVFNLEKKRGLFNYWPFLIIGTAVLWSIAYAMIGLMDIPGLSSRIDSLSILVRLLICAFSAWGGYEIMLKARKNYYLIREIKMEIKAANAKWRELLDKKIEQKIKETPDL